MRGRRVVGMRSPLHHIILTIFSTYSLPHLLTRGRIFLQHRHSRFAFSLIPAFSYSTSLISDSRLEYESQKHKFQAWDNGGGSFHCSARIDPTAFIEFGAIIHSNCVLSANVHIGSGTIVGPAVSVGQSTKIGYNVCLINCTIGDSNIIHNGVCVGQDGFGFFVDEHAIMNKKPQTKVVRVGNHVEIGANSCIDRGSWRDTVIGDNTKIDNLVQVGHNVVIGRGCMLCGQVGVSGSVTLGDFVTLGGRVAVRDHVCIASKVRIAGNGCVTKHIKMAGDYGGFPAVPIREWRKEVVLNRYDRRRQSRRGTTMACMQAVTITPKHEEEEYSD